MATEESWGGEGRAGAAVGGEGGASGPGGSNTPTHYNDVCPLPHITAAHSLD